VHLERFSSLPAESDRGTSHHIVLKSALQKKPGQRKRFNVDAGDILNILKKAGPQTGGQLLEKTGMEALPLWQICRQAPEVRFERVGRRFLRLDRNVEGYARLSPSIRREFMTYTLLGLSNQDAEMEAKAQQLSQEISRISQTKLELAKEAMATTVQAIAHWESIHEQVCFIIAGDVTYEMAHAVPRPEISTGKMVRGSDLDIIVIAENDVPMADLKELDNAILRKKHYLLVHPNFQEEIDYLVKNIARVRQQLSFDSFQHMVASKIINEGMLLYGSNAVFRKVKSMVVEFGVAEKLAFLEKRAMENRIEAETSLLCSGTSRAYAAYINLFYTHEEGDEIY